MHQIHPSARRLLQPRLNTTSDHSSEKCRAQDSDHGKGPWELQDSGHPQLLMTDRALNFVNEVADRVSRVHPDKQIEMYAYASTGPPPKRERVHPNVLVKIT